MAQCARCGSEHLTITEQFGCCNDCGLTVMFGCLINVNNNLSVPDTLLPVITDHETIDEDFDPPQGTEYSLETADA